MIGDHLRGNAVAYLALFFALTGSAAALSHSESQTAAEPRVKKAASGTRLIHNGDLATGAVDERVIQSRGVARSDLRHGIVNGAKVGNRSLEGRDIARATITGRKIDQRSLDRSIIQFRVNGSCPEGSAIRRVHRDGTSTCEPTGAGTLTGITTSGGLTGGGDAGVVDVGTDPSVLQNRIGDSCPAGEAVESVNMDGTVNCVAVGTGTVTRVDAGTGLTGGPITGTGTISADTNILQRRVTGTCSGTQAFQSITGGGAVGCSTSLQAAGHVLTPGVLQVTEGDPPRIALQLDTMSLVLDCPVGGNAEAELHVDGATAANLVSDSQSVGRFANAVVDGNSAVIADSALDRGDFNALSTSNETLAASYYVAKVGARCQMRAAGLTN